MTYFHQGLLTTYSRGMMLQVPTCAIRSQGQPIRGRAK